MYKSIHCVFFFLPFPFLVQWDLGSGLLCGFFSFFFFFLMRFHFSVLLGRTGRACFFFLRFLSPFAGFDGLLL